MVFIDKEHHKCQIIDVAIPYDTRVDDKEVEKIKKYLNFARELNDINIIISSNIDIDEKIEQLVKETLKKCKTNIEDKKQKNKKLAKIS